MVVLLVLVGFVVIACVLQGCYYLVGFVDCY